MIQMNRQKRGRVEYKSQSFDDAFLLFEHLGTYLTFIYDKVFLRIIQTQ